MKKASLVIKDIQENKYNEKLGEVYVDSLLIPHQKEKIR